MGRSSGLGTQRCPSIAYRSSVNHTASGPCGPSGCSPSTIFPCNYVITAREGDLAGENFKYHHPQSVAIRFLRERAIIGTEPLWIKELRVHLIVPAPSDEAVVTGCVESETIVSGPKSASRALPSLSIMMFALVRDTSEGGVVTNVRNHTPFKSPMYHQLTVHICQPLSGVLKLSEMILSVTSTVYSKNSTMQA